jgi:hypothetical protein
VDPGKGIREIGFGFTGGVLPLPAFSVAHHKKNHIRYFQFGTKFDPISVLQFAPKSAPGKPLDRGAHLNGS